MMMEAKLLELAERVLSLTGGNVKAMYVKAFGYQRHQTTIACISLEKTELSLEPKAVLKKGLKKGSVNFMRVLSA